jgi:hypothetical protein
VSRSASIARRSRYPDLTVHRLIRKYLIEKSMDNKEVKRWEDKLPELAEHTSKPIDEPLSQDNV